MRAPSSSKNPKKNSDEDRSKKKKIKSKSAKRRRGSSISSHSSSSSSELDSRSRRKRSKSKKLEKRRREWKKSDKRRSRKKRYRRDSTSFSSESCSTCSDSERSRSPVRKSKSRKRDRKSSRRRESGGRSRYRSPSCSTCSSGDRSRSRSRSRSPVAIEERFGARSRSPVAIEERFGARSRSPVAIEERLGARSRSPVAIEERLLGARSCSPVAIEERFGARSRSPVAIEERFGARSRSCSPIAIEDDRFGNSCGQSTTRIEERFGARSCSLSPVPIKEERFRSSHGRSPVEERYREVETRRLKSVVAVTKASDDDDNMIIKAYDDYPSSRSNETHGKGDENKNLEVGMKNKGSNDEQIRDEVILSEDKSRPIKDSGKTMMKKEGNVVVEDGGNEADELELILRQKALENFRKFRGGQPANRASLNEKKDGKKDETTKLESYQGLLNFVKPLESKHLSSINGQRNAQEEPNLNRSKARSVADVPRKEIDGNAMRSPSNDAGDFRPSAISSQSAPNLSKHNPTKSIQIQSRTRSVSNVPMEGNDRNVVHGISNDIEDFKPVASSITSQKTKNPLKNEQESSIRIPAEETSLAEDNQNLEGVANTGSGMVSKAEVGTTDKPVPGTLITENPNSKSNEPVTESASGSQFEQKTFSRMRDGEVVQVSYKVYIPKKSPALARRQLQR